ncbi:50S ribosomal protein L2 [Candidatus Vidania fulgoroideorum]
MKIINSKPKTPGLRFKTKIKIEKFKTFKKLTKIKKNKSGRNNKGKITVRHKGGGVKKKYRILDFKKKNNIEGKIESIEKDPNRSGLISRILYKDGERKYNIYIKNTKIGDRLINGDNVCNKIGNSKKIKNIPIGSKICCLEITPNRGSKLLRSAGAFGILISIGNKYSVVKLKSNSMRKFNNDCFATIGEVGNELHSLIKFGKAGVKRLIGIRPTVRGVAMNPVDHPHGGGEGKTSSGRNPVSPWGKLTKGFKTRKNKRTKKFIVKQ